MVKLPNPQRQNKTKNLVSVLHPSEIVFRRFFYFKGLTTEVLRLQRGTENN